MPERALWLLGVLACLLPPFAQAQDGPDWIYRGRMGSYAVLENARDHSQEIVKVGKTIGGMRVVSIDAKAVVLSRDGRQLRLEMQTGYSNKQKARYEDIPPYPQKIPRWWQRATEKLDTLWVTPRWKKIAPEEILRQLMEYSGLPVSLTPKASLKLSQRESLSLDANRMTLRATFDLTATMLGLRWWISQVGLRFGLAGEASSPPEQVAVQAGLTRAAARALALFDKGKRRPPTAGESERVRAALSKATVDGQLTADSVAALLRKLAERAGVTLVFDTVLAQRLSRSGQASVVANRESVNELLLRLAAKHKLGYQIEGTVLHLTSQQQAALQAQERSRTDAARTQLDAWRSTLEQKQLNEAAKDALPHRLAGQLSRTLGMPVHCDEATWRLRVKLSFPRGTSIKAVNQQLIRLRIYPIYLEKTLYLIRGR